MSPEAALAAFFDAARPPSLGLAVSGGGDSMALLHLAAGWAEGAGVRLEVATVDHRLRPEAAAEAAMVARATAALGLRHETLVWQEAPGRGNLQDAARRARYRLLAGWARGRGLQAVALGHTLDDQAETFLMRLGRGSGVDGLSAMRADWQADGMRWLRPLLWLRRADLRAWLKARAIAWAEDPSNEDSRYARVRARRALAELAPLGIGAEGLAATAGRLAGAREALARSAHEAARAYCRIEAGEVVFAPAALDLPEETLARLVAHALCWVSSSEYRPRHAALLRVLAGLGAGRRAVLHGCLLSPGRGGGAERGAGFRIGREYQAVRGETARPGALWDRRWRLTGPDPEARIGALGDALDECPGWRETGLSRDCLSASPAAFRADRLIAAPLAGLANGWSAAFAPARGDFHDTLLFH